MFYVASSKTLELELGWIRFLVQKIDARNDGSANVIIVA